MLYQRLSAGTKKILNQNSQSLGQHFKSKPLNYKAGIDHKVQSLIIGVCILSRVYQLNIRTPQYTTNISACFTVNSLCHMFRP
jgi:hypothetical protein